VILKDDLWRLRRKRMEAERNNKETEADDRKNKESSKKSLLRRLLNFVFKKKD